MKVEFELWHLITLALTLIGMFTGLGKLLLRQFERRIDERLGSFIYKTYGEDAEEELDCVPKNGGGAYLSRALIESRMDADTPVLDLSLPEGFEMYAERLRVAEVNAWLIEHVQPHLDRLSGNAGGIRGIVYGWDFARHVDLSIMTPLVEDKTLNRRVPFVLELRKVPFEQQKQILFYVGDRLPRLRAGAHDSTGNGMYLGEVAAQRYGSRIHQVAMTEGVYAEHMPKMKADLQDGTLSGLPRSSDWLDDLRAVQNIKGVPKIPALRTTSKSGGKRHGDGAVSLMLANSVARTEYAPIEFQSAGARPSMGEAIGRSFGDDGFGTVPGGNDFGGYV